MIQLTTEQYKKIRRVLESAEWGLIKAIASESKPSAVAFVGSNDPRDNMAARRLSEIAGWELAVAAFDASGTPPEPPQPEPEDTYPDTGLPGYEQPVGAKE